MQEDHRTRRKIIREWMALATDKRQTEEQAVIFAKKAAEQNEFHRSQRDPSHQFRRNSYQRVLGWLVPRAGKA
jgi:RNase P protein component